MPDTLRAFCALLVTACLVPAVAKATPVQPWVAPGARVARVGADAGAEDGHYQIPHDLVMLGESLEAGLVVSNHFIASLGVEYDVVLDSSPEGPNGSLAMVDLTIPARARFLGLGDDRTRFYLVLGLGYAAVWDFTYQFGHATSDRSALRSSGALYEAGACVRLRFNQRLSLEIGILPRLLWTSSSNGTGYYERASFVQSSVPVYLSLPVSL